MTLEEYHFYSDMATKLFNYMNGNINRMNSKCTLYIDMYDYIQGTYANIRYPNYVYIHIGTIIDSWEDDWTRYMRKVDYVGSCIAWALAHELHHADQLISMLQYNRNIDYRNEVERDVTRASYDWVAMHSRELSIVGGFNVVITDIDSNTLEDTANYRKANPKEFYLQTILNIIIRDHNLFNRIRVFTEDDLASDIVLNFNGVDSVVVKTKGKYLSENINQFSTLAYKWAGYYDRYNIKVNVQFATIDNRSIAFVNFVISNNFINPMIFKQ